MPESILLVDDDSSVIDVCDVALRRLGYEVTAASTGEEALHLVESKAFDLVLTDLHMPGSVDGGAVVRRVKARYPTTEVVVLTGLPTLKTAVDTLKEGASDYVIKPFSIEHLKMTIRRCLDQRKLRDQLSSERTLRQELESAYQELQKVERLKEAFLARVSHELRTPLSQLRLGLHLLEEELRKSPSEKTQKKSEEILSLSLQGTQRLEKTIFDLLAFVDMYRLKTIGASTPLDFEAICRKTVGKLKPLWESSHLMVEISFPAGSGQIRGDADALERAVEHLVHNAIVFNKEGGHIGIGARVAQNFLEVDFSDTGEGIPEGEFSKIFDGFYQIADYLTRKVQGMGLGLATTRRIVEAHGGAIHVSSKPGKGTVFTVKLPLKGPTPAPTPPPTPASPKTPSAS